MDVTDAETVTNEGWVGKVVQAADLTALAAEVAASTLGDSPAIDMALKWLDTQPGESSAVQEWKRLRSLHRDEEHLLRQETAKRELLDAISDLIERR